MKPIVISLLFLNFCISLVAQNQEKDIVAKPVLDTSVLGRWPSAEMPTISSDGNYALYTIRNQPAGSKTLVIRSLKNNWKKEIVNASNALFTSDSHIVFFINPRKTLCTLNLGNDNIDSVAATNSYQLIKQGNNEWFVYQLNNAAKELKTINLKNNQEKSFKGVIDYLFSSDGNVLVLLEQSDVDTKLQTIKWVNFPSGNTINIWEGNGATNFVFDEGANQLAFVVETKDSSFKETKLVKAVFSYKKGDEKAELLADNRTKGMDSSLLIEGIADGFNKDGKKLFITLREKERPKPQPGKVMVDVWSYHDVKLQSMQLAEISNPHSFKAVIRINNDDIVQLQHEGDEDVSTLGESKNMILITYNVADLSESHWNVASQRSYFLVSPDNILRQKLEIGPVPPFPISPNGKFLVGKGVRDRNNYFSYEIANNRTVNITHSIAAPFDEILDDKPRLPKTKCLEQANWLKNEDGILINDRYDLWLVDPNGANSPINLTNGYGEKHHIIFQLPDIYSYKSISNNSRVFLKGFNRISKEEGLYMIQLGKLGDPKLLVKGPYRYEIPENSFNSAQLDSTTSTFLIRRESATQSPNYFLTSDFKTFTSVTEVYPESSCNWLTSELHTWKSLNGEPLQGILYKPQNFDPKKKYPVIFHYYQRMSDQLNRYLAPAAITDHLNIPWFVSNGYLVFTPDIHYEIGKTGKSALNAVVSAAHYLQRFSWVDGKRMGLQGQSFGGYETNYIVTHSTLFAAAMSSAGFSDFISDYDGISHGGRSRQGFYEVSQNRIGATLWERPDLYIVNSPIFSAHKVTTPILLMNNKGDGGVPFDQGVEFFTALRRLGKRAWMLQYDGEDHVIFLSHKAVALQHTIRVTQFFDHYLKGRSAPFWMTRGIPASKKGLDDGLEFDNQVETPGEGLLRPENRMKIEVLRYRRPLTVTVD